MKHLRHISAALVGGALTFGLVACGDEVTEQITEQVVHQNSSIGSVDTEKDLPECKEDLAGQTAYVKKQDGFFGCDGKKWRQIGSNSVSFGDNFCYSEKRDDGFEIFCNNESLGQVFNGKDGQEGEPGSAGSDGKPGSAGSNGSNGQDGKPGEGCKLIDKQVDSLKVVIQCGTETFPMNLGGLETVSDCDADDKDCADPQGDVQLSGQSQKGPFVSGTDVSAYELLDGKTLKQTGNMFAGKIERDDGLFNIKTVKLSSQYAYLVADGFYRNEVTGKVSSTTLKLRALANLKRKSTANINLITHLEYDRASNLVTGKTAMKVMDAKNQAEKEILKAFHIDTTIIKSGEYAEDFNILSDKGSGNGALLAISVMLQGDRTEAQLTAVLASFSVDIGIDGKWDNEELRAEIADWTMKKDMSKGGFASIKNNIENWKIANTVVPSFESYARNFWMTELGFAGCSDKNVGTIATTRNKNSEFYAAKDSAYTEGDSTLARFICAANGDTYAWRIATDYEKDVAALEKASAQGAVSFGKINDNLVYVYENSAWRRGTDLDARLKFSCIADSIGKTVADTVKQVVSYYACDKDGSKIDGNVIPTAWRNCFGIEADTTGFGIPKDGDNLVKNGNINKSRYYVYENGKWRLGTDMDFAFQEGCSKNLKGKVREFNKKYYTCSDYRKLVEETWIEYTWRESTADEADLYGKTCSVDGEVIQGNVDVTNVFVCQGGEWISAGESYLLGECSSDMDGDVKKSPISSSYYVCDFESHGWRMTMDLQDQDSELRGCTLRRSQKTPEENVEGSGFKYVPGEVKAASDGVHYLCKNQRWEPASEARWKTYGRKCSSAAGDTLMSYVSLNGEKTYFACDVDSFRVATNTEKWLVQYAKPNTGNRCAKQDEGVRILTTNDGHWECKGGLLKAKPYKLPLLSGKYIQRTGVSSGVVIGTQTWMRMNSAYSDVPHSTYEGMALDNHGYQYLYEDAVKVCENTSIRRGFCASNAISGFCDNSQNMATRLPTREDWEVLYQTIGGDWYLEELFADTSWKNLSGTDDYKFGLLASGYQYTYTLLDKTQITDVSTRGYGIELWLQDAGTVIFTDSSMTFGQAKNRFYQRPVRCIMKDDIPPQPTYN